MKKLLLILIIPLPQPVKRWIYRKVFGWAVADSAYVGLSFVYVLHAQLGPHAKIGNFNIIRHLHRLELGEGAEIGSRNYITAAPFSSSKAFCRSEHRDPALILGPYASVTGRHFFDCNDRIEIGGFSIVAGRESCFYTHGIDVQTNRQTVAPISIGSYCMIGARCMFVKGAVLPDCSVLGAQSLLHKKMNDPYTLYSGNPARSVKRFDEEAAFFRRQAGFVD